MTDKVILRSCWSVNLAKPHYIGVAVWTTLIGGLSRQYLRLSDSVPRVIHRSSERLAAGSNSMQNN